MFHDMKHDNYAVLTESKNKNPTYMYISLLFFHLLIHLNINFYQIKFGLLTPRQQITNSVFSNIGN